MNTQFYFDLWHGRKKYEYWKIDAFELGVGEDSWESLGLQGDPISPY